ncbi:MAG: lysylphosphatidylglycerol synthase transmembrane domain-containing protein, partial [Bacteroidota bacterium]
MNRKITSRLIGLSGIIVSVLCIWLLSKSIDFRQTWRVIQEVNPLFIPALMGIYLLTFPLRSIRWRYMMHSFSIPHDGIFIQSLFIGFAGNNVLPARGGELLRMETFSRRTGVSRTASLSSILLEKVMDVFVLMILLIAGFMGMRQASPLVEKTIWL